MKKIKQWIETLNEWLEPLHDWAGDEDLQKEMFAAIGAVMPADGQATKDKIKSLQSKLDDVKTKSGSSDDDAPDVDNIKALLSILAQVGLAFGALREIYQSLEFIYNDDEADETKINNAIRATSSILTLSLLKKKAPELAAFAEAIGIFSDEYNELKRALYLVSTWDGFTPVGDPNADVRQRISKAIFLDASAALLLLKIPFDKIGHFLFNFSYELPLEKDNFKNANRIASRVLQMQYIRDQEFDIPVLDRVADSIISFVTIPVLDPATLSDEEPKVLGYQYVLKFELSSTDLLTTDDESDQETEKPKFSIPANFNASVIWGYETETEIFSGDKFGADPLLNLIIPKSNDQTPDTSPDTSPPSARRIADQPKNNSSNSVRRGHITAKMQPRKVGDKDDLDTRVELTDFSLNLSGEGRDGFLQKILPDTAQVKADLTIGYSIHDGFYFEGLDAQDGLFFQIKIGKTLFGKLEIPILYVGLKPHSNENKEIRGATLEASALIRLILGPFQMTVDRLGLYLTLDFPEKADGNLGAADLDLGLKPPSGIGFLVKAKSVEGGGFLSFDPDKGEYFGAAELKFNKSTSISAVAVLLTHLPNGEKGYSFLLLVNVAFKQGYDIGLGFKLKAVGGLVAINRKLDIDAWRDGVHDDRFDSILFPDNPVGNAPTIVKAMNALFPAVEGRYAFGLMARIEWCNTKKFVDIKAGLLVEVPLPLTFALVGVVKIGVKTEKLKLVDLQINFLVVLELERKMLSIDASLYNSEFVSFKIKGDVFVRVRWDSDPFFLFSVGGFHPDFSPPAGLSLPATMQRLAIPLRETDRLHLELTCYFAVTSNTFQFGAALDLKAKYSKFRLEAGLSFDALFHFEPFYFIVDLDAKLHIYWGDHRLAGIRLHGNLSGCSPWHFLGEATFSIWIWDYDVSINKTWGDEDGTTLPETEVLPMLVAAIKDPGNWRSALPEGRSLNAISRSTEKDSSDANKENPPLLFDPLSQLQIAQQIIPLGIRIDKVGFQRAKDFRKFDLKLSEGADSNVEGETLNEFFAPAMFLDLDDAARISRKSFESMPAGRSFVEAQLVSSGSAQVIDCDYEDEFFDPMTAPESQKQPKLPLLMFQKLVANNSIARSKEGRKATNRMEDNTRKSFASKERFIVVDSSSGKKIEDASDQHSMAEAYYEDWKVKRKNPLLKTKIIPVSETLN